MAHELNSGKYIFFNTDIVDIKGRSIVPHVSSKFFLNDSLGFSYPVILKFNA